MATPEEITSLREYVQGLTTEERTAFDARVATLRRQAPAPLHDPETGKALAIPRMPLMRSEHLDLSTPEGKVNNALMILTGAGGVARGLAAGASRAGLPGLVSAGGQTLKKAAVYAGVGGAVTASPLPIIGGKTFKEGAQLGTAMALGQGGVGALWKHGKRRGAIDWLGKWLGKKLGADDIDELVKAADNVASVPAGMSGTPVTAAAVPRAVAPAARAGAARGGASTIPPQTAPAPAPAAAPATSPRVPWVRRGGSKAERALLEHTGQVPGAMGADDVAAMRARGATQEQIEAALLRAARPTIPWGQKSGTIAAPAAAKAAPAAVTSKVGREQIALITELAKQKGNRAALKKAVKEMFGENWEEVWRLATAA